MSVGFFFWKCSKRLFSSRDLVHVVPPLYFGAWGPPFALWWILVHGVPPLHFGEFWCKNHCYVIIYITRFEYIRPGEYI